jgi:hypothetical protein
MTTAGRTLSQSKRLAYTMAYRPGIDRAALRGSSAVRQMADDFLIFAANAGCVCKDELEILGWTPSQIELHASTARQAAHRSADA